MTVIIPPMTKHDFAKTVCQRTFSNTQCRCLQSLFSHANRNCPGWVNALVRLVNHIIVFAVSKVKFFSKARLLNDQRRFLVFPLGGEFVFVVSQVKFVSRVGCAMISEGF